YLTAPAWLASDTHAAYSIAKYIGVAVMASTVFPVYGLARMLVSRPAALFAAAAAAAIPALAYSSMLVEEPLAYPYSALCLFLIFRTLVRPTRWWIVGTIAAAIVAPFVRGELVGLWAVIVLALLFLVWQTDRVGRWRAEWTTWDWVGFVVLLLGAAVTVSAVLGKGSFEWLISTDHYKRRIFDFGLNAGGALALGLGVFPLVARLA